MQNNISSANTYLNAPCERCGGKKRVARTWKEKIPTLTGTVTIVEYSQIVCRNKTCQEEFERKQVEETEKRQAIKVKKDENTALRKAKSLFEANKARTIKSKKA